VREGDFRSALVEANERLAEVALSHGRATDTVNEAQ
jgi:ABC-type uncharacterized transport system fused permease/ATPase subunit